jgi:DNA mismatch endonuclease (patch repair protein)
MSRIRGKHTGPELALRSALWREGLRYRVHVSLPGKPDLAFPSARVAVFIDGCFWHGCPEHSTRPKANAGFWREKIGGNIARDTRVNEALKSLGWRVLRFWEHDLSRNVQRPVTVIQRAVTRR